MEQHEKIQSDNTRHNAACFDMIQYDIRNNVVQHIIRFGMIQTYLELSANPIPANTTEL